MSTDLNQYYLQQMGIQVWVERPVNSALIKLSQLEHRVSSCTNCDLHQHRTKSVFGRGNSPAKLMIIGDAPGIDDDQEGKPFVGRGGALLCRMLSSIGLLEDDVYMTTILKCRPPSTSSSCQAESNLCGRYLTEQIALVAPALLLVLGSVAGQFMTKTCEPLNTLRKSTHHYGNIPYVVSFHPEHLLHNPRDKKEAYNDWLDVQRLLSDTI